MRIAAGLLSCLNLLLGCSRSALTELDTIGSGGPSNEDSASPTQQNPEFSSANGGAAGPGSRNGNLGGAGSSASGGTSSWGGVGSALVTGGVGPFVPTGGVGATLATGGVGTGGDPGVVAAEGPALHVSFADKRPGGVMLGNYTGLLLALDRQDNLVAVGPRLAHDLSQPDPGPRITKLSPSGAALDVQDYPGAVTPEVIAVDSTGAVILAGQLYRAVSFGGSVLVPIENASYLAKLDANGKQLWIRAIERPDSFWLRTLVVDAADNIYLGGGQQDMSGGWYEHAHVAKYAPDGIELWHQQFRNSDSTGVANGLAFFSNGAIAVAGAFNGALQVGTQQLKTTASLSGFGSYNGWFAHLDPATGSPSSAQRFGGTIFDQAHAVGVTSTDALRLSGTLSGQSSVAGVIAKGDSHGSPFVAEVDASGQGRWIRLLGSRGSLGAAATGAGDRTIAVGRFDPEAGTTMGIMDATSSYVAVVEASSLVSQLFTFNTRANGAFSVVSDSQGDAWVSGEFTGAVAFGSFLLTASDYQLFLVKLSAGL